MAPPPPNDLGFVRHLTGGSFYEILTAAIRYFSENGFDSEDSLSEWMLRIRQAAERSLTPLDKLQKELNNAFRTIYRAQVERGGLLKHHPGVSRFTLDKVSPRLRGELDRRIMASAQLIKLNRAQAVERTLQRFSGWATSIPDGGSDVVNRRGASQEIRKALAQLPFEERRVSIDQGHKFAANLNSILAVDAGALAGIWHSHKDEAGYNGRPKHNARDGKLFLVRDSWALNAGLIKSDGLKYTDQIEQPAEFVYCRCFYQYVYALRRLPDEVLTQKGRDELARAREARAA